jgi:hypothetical protein
MAFVAALLVSYLGGEEEEVFWLLVALMRSPCHGLSGLYAPGLPLAERHNHCLVGLLNTLRPAVARRLRQLDIHPTVSQWRARACRMRRRRGLRARPLNHPPAVPPHPALPRCTRARGS